MVIESTEIILKNGQKANIPHMSSSALEILINNEEGTNCHYCDLKLEVRMESGEEIEIAMDDIQNIIKSNSSVANI